MIGTSRGWEVDEGLLIEVGMGLVTLYGLWRVPNRSRGTNPQSDSEPTPPAE